MDIVTKLLTGDKLALARAISNVENGAVTPILKSIFKHTGRAYYIGVTGPPGAGKSTLVNQITCQLLDNHKKVGVIAVDPTSPFSGGALLGDRIRMSDLTTREGVFIRSMASRGSLGGLAKATKNVALLFDAFGMDYIIIETIGVGQVELDIASVCDTVVVALVPESGDAIQAMKAGLLEIADIIIVNKADREGADRVAVELKFITELRNTKQGWEYPIIKTIATEGKGIDELMSLIELHHQYLKTSGDFESKRKQRIKERIKELIDDKIRKLIEKDILTDEKLDSIVSKIYNRELDLFETTDEITLTIFQAIQNTKHKDVV